MTIIDPISLQLTKMAQRKNDELVAFLKNPNVNSFSLEDTLAFQLALQDYGTANEMRSNYSNFKYTSRKSIIEGV